MSAQHTPGRRKWTMPDNKTRAASEGPWIAICDVADFIAFCEANGHTTRKHTDPFRDGYQVRHAGHWMGLLRNKSFGRYTADRRLSLVVQSFAAIAKDTGGAS